MALPRRVLDGMQELLHKEPEKLVKTVQSCLDFLTEHGMVTTMKLPPLAVGVHPSNRDGCGVNPSDVHELIDNISGVGWVDSKVNGIAVEVEDSHRNFNQQICLAAAGALGTVDSMALKAVTLCGSHTNYALRLIVQEAFYKAATTGITFKVLNKEVARQWPDLLPMIQQYGNASLQKQEHELQMLCRLHALYVAQHAKGGAVSFAEIKRKALQSRPPCAAAVPALYSFVLKASGGSTGELLKETERFVRQRCSSARSLGADLWEVLAHEPKGFASSGSLALFRHAMVKLAYSSKKMGKAECKKMFSQDIKRDVVTADALMNELRSLARHHADPSTPQVFIAQGLTDQMLASFAIKLRLPDEKLYESFDEICHDFVLVLRHMTGQPVPSRWEAGLKEEEKAKVKESDSQASLRELKEDGTFKDPAKVLAEMGFPVGSHIRRKSDKTEAVITEVVEDNVKVSIDGGFFKVLQDLAQYATSQSWNYEASLTAAKITLELEDLSKKYKQDQWHALELQLKPGKVLQVVQPIQKHKLILAPTTSKVMFKWEGVPAAGVKVETDWEDACSFFLLADSKLPGDDEPEDPKDCSFCPYFSVEKTSKEDESNMEVFWAHGRDSTLRFPLLRNTRKLETGERLMIWQEKVSQAVEPLAAASPAKRPAPEGGRAKKRSK
ncbi:Uncharacterized protein SCF082_LOCUS17338 [Durusdinium trenchii]|uniref:Uncharacterized protein n=1 Tax=Durusdinium trenchii TaxID=1381693 RepID=A0ABP0KGY8_9DINO